jgi:HTH-type transcriptional repressor of NAD biosynthesis genes
VEAKSKKQPMTTGLLPGKFMLLHTGHVKMIQFALQHCDSLILLLCSHTGEPIAGDVRYKWLRETFAQE